MNSAGTESNHSSPILRTVTRFAVPMAAYVAARLFLQGHNLPGGGFIAGVMIACAGAMVLMGWGDGKASVIAWWRLAVCGLLIALATGTVPLLLGSAFMDNVIWHVDLPVAGGFELPTATFFDLGVMLIVAGTLMTIFVELMMEKR